MSISVVNMGFIFPILLIPFFILINRNPNRIIRKCSKVLLLFSAITAIGIFPLYCFFQWGVKILIIPMVPILSRGVTWILEKTNIFNTDHMVTVDKLLKLSIASVGLGLLAIAYDQPLKPIVATIVVMAFILFINIGKYIISGYLFGIVLAVFMISQSTDAMYTVVFIFIIVMLILRFFDKVFSFSDRVRTSIESSAAIIILLASYPLIIKGGLQFYFEDFFIQIVVFIGLLLIYLGTTFLIHKIRVPGTLQHYIPTVISLALVFLILESIKNSNIANSFGVIFYFLILIFLGLTFLRVMSPLDTILHGTSLLNSANMLGALQFYFGKKFGQTLFVFLYGKASQSINTIFSLLMLGVHIVGVLFIYKQLSPEASSSVSLNNDYMYYTVLSVCASFSFVLSISRAIDKEKLNIGMDNEEAMKCSTAIALNYFFTLFPFLLIGYKQLKEIGIVGIIFGIVYIFMIIVNTNFALWRDFSKPRYNDFAISRGYLSVAILILPHIALVGAFYYFFDIKNPLESLRAIIGVFLMISLLFGIVARVMSYDNFLGSKKLRRMSFWALPLLIVGLKPLTMANAVIFLLIGFNREFAIQLTFYFEISFLMDIVTLIIIALSPSSNDDYKGNMMDLVRKWRDDMRNY
ncbi:MULTISPECIES: hypothetical protein [unclassified Paenibacillus]|uniref:hypothetical protein n=1 Tax=unclassified Paenibacillus TaxID=185978 RepID=UPI0009A79918|nr:MULTISPECIES: hypothetical protein [unclassified Paenibacillus]SLK07562.1 hypothetical protein SAMN06272722_10510 [Paenibacillus sp. RU5A]SOC70768.1 hypothetical protein SAMN05880581_10510 [Paenibacillus sp. RU26A]SOC73102.1 hypothetical protein SAMN05880586_10510 [Paenibacillus sp. RU5M]